MEANRSHDKTEAMAIQPTAAHIGTPAIYGAESEPAADHTHHTDNVHSKRARMVAFSLLLTVPVALTACADNDEANCQYDQNGNPYNCNTYSSHSSSGSSSSRYYKHSSSSDSHSGFGSSGSFFSSFGG
ncbi:hypothetical protein [Paenibacillus campi]|uniref:hypothetical protein n=1 Tax=Paenibacillus campi TaxID=3106031 RepID=UPI002AFE988E|nr:MULTISPECIES: hypothetical protein [unclassified Paenibacillus]